MRIAMFVLASTFLVVAERAEAGGPLLAEDPPLPPPRDVREVGEGPLYYRLPPGLVAASLRIGGGMSERLGGGASAPGKPAGAFDVLAGATWRFGRAAKAGVIAEGGYGYEGYGEHLALLGLGLLVRDLGPTFIDDNPRHGAFSVALVPHVACGASSGAFTLGERTSLLLGFWVLGVEVGQQTTFVSGHPTQELHLMFTSASFGIGGGS